MKYYKKPYNSSFFNLDLPFDDNSISDRSNRLIARIIIDYLRKRAKGKGKKH